MSSNDLMISCPIPYLLGTNKFLVHLRMFFNYFVKMFHDKSLTPRGMNSLSLLVTIPSVQPRPAPNNKFSRGAPKQAATLCEILYIAVLFFLIYI